MGAREGEYCSESGVPLPPGQTKVTCCPGLFCGMVCHSYDTKLEDSTKTQCAGEGESCETSECCDGMKCTADGCFPPSHAATAQVTSMPNSTTRTQSAADHGVRRLTVLV